MCCGLMFRISAPPVCLGRALSRTFHVQPAPAIRLAPLALLGMPQRCLVPPLPLRKVRSCGMTPCQQGATRFDSWSLSTVCAPAPGAAAAAPAGQCRCGIRSNQRVCGCSAGVNNPGTWCVCSRQSCACHLSALPGVYLAFAQLLHAVSPVVSVWFFMPVLTS